MTVRHVKYFMSCWTREERVPRKVGSTYLTNLGSAARATHRPTHSHVHTLARVDVNKRGESWKNIPSTFGRICHSSLSRCELVRAEQLRRPLAHLARQQKSNWLIDGNLFCVWSRGRRETQIHTRTHTDGILEEKPSKISRIKCVDETENIAADGEMSRYAQSARPRSPRPPRSPERITANTRPSEMETRPELSLRAIDCVGGIFSASWLRLEYHPPDRLPGRCTWVAAARPERGRSSRSALNTPQVSCTHRWSSPRQT